MIKVKDGVFINKWNAFQMLMWLCAYYNFFCVRKVNAYSIMYMQYHLLLFYEMLIIPLESFKVCS